MQNITIFAKRPWLKLILELLKQERDIKFSVSLTGERCRFPSITSERKMSNKLTDTTDKWLNEHLPKSNMSNGNTGLKYLRRIRFWLKMTLNSERSTEGNTENGDPRWVSASLVIYNGPVRGLVESKQQLTPKTKGVSRPVCGGTVPGPYKKHSLFAVLWYL